MFVVEFEEQFNADGAGGIAVDHEGNVYVANYGNRHIHKFTNTGKFLTKWGGPGPFAGSSWGLTVEGTYAYVADNLALLAMDISDPTAPVIVGSVDTREARDVAVSGAHAFVADGPSGLQVVDISDPTAPVIVGSVDTPGGARDVEVDGAYVSSSSAQAKGHR